MQFTLLEFYTGSFQQRLQTFTDHIGPTSKISEVTVSTIIH